VQEKVILAANPDLIRAVAVCLQVRETFLRARNYIARENYYAPPSSVLARF